MGSSEECHITYWVGSTPDWMCGGTRNKLRVAKMHFVRPIQHRTQSNFASCSLSIRYTCSGRCPTEEEKHEANCISSLLEGICCKEGRQMAARGGRRRRRRLGEKGHARQPRPPPPATGEKEVACGGGPGEESGGGSGGGGSEEEASPLLLCLRALEPPRRPHPLRHRGDRRGRDQQLVERDREAELRARDTAAGARRRRGPSPQIRRARALPLHGSSSLGLFSRRLPPSPGRRRSRGGEASKPAEGQTRVVVAAAATRRPPPPSNGLLYHRSTTVVVD
jgi:hypothetical protein